jgi:fluoride exporter
VSVAAVIAVGLLGGCGAVARLLGDEAVSDLLPMTFPIGTFAVNMAGSLAIGVLAGVTTDEQTLRLLAIGLLGSFTTFSTWMFESQRLAEDGEPGPTIANIVGSLLVGVPLAWLGLQIGGLL